VAFGNEGEYAGGKMEFNTSSELVERVKALAREGFSPRYGELEDVFDPHPRWDRLCELGSRLWLDTGDIEGAAQRWSEEMEALTTNNTLLNREVQKGIYDDLIAESLSILDDAGLTRQQLIMEIAFILNARHGLRLVERFDARVSVELHTGLAHDIERTVWYGQRLFDICPERFIVKVPLTPAGYLAARRLNAASVAVNFTLGFSARQNYLAAMMAWPGFVNVFLGRLNSFVASNDLGAGENVGEKTTIASQQAVEALRSQEGMHTRQIAASMRSGDQVMKLAGVDVMTMPLNVADDFLALDSASQEFVSFADQVYPVALEAEVEEVVNKLWRVPPSFKESVDELLDEPLGDYQADDLRAFWAERGFGDLFPEWSQKDVAVIEADGKIPDYTRWAERLQVGQVALDALMSKSGLHQFAADQKELDARIASNL
jgi:transaldolase